MHICATATLSNLDWSISEEDVNWMKLAKIIAHRGAVFSGHINISFEYMSRAHI